MAVFILNMLGHFLFELHAETTVVHTGDVVYTKTHNIMFSIVSSTESWQDQVMTGGKPGKGKRPKEKNRRIRT